MLFSESISLDYNVKSLRLLAALPKGFSDEANVATPRFGPYSTISLSPRLGDPEEGKEKQRVEARATPPPLCCETGRTCRKPFGLSLLFYIALRYVKRVFPPEQHRREAPPRLALSNAGSGLKAGATLIRGDREAATPSRCDRAFGIEWPHPGGASPNFPRRPGRQSCARLSGCDRGRGRKAPGGRSHFPAFFRLLR